ncbi:uncharacterized protein PG986_005703 [Apiospora aurea]|uniref:Major facilitator superfamily (MFS) profile domain-containing protein n=1 Tax=Apiospora aurea TaxID=335848 RepID=A0ABR1QIB7_9PEZI
MSPEARTAPRRSISTPGNAAEPTPDGGTRPVLAPLEVDAGDGNTTTDARIGGGGGGGGPNVQSQRNYIQGWRLYTLITALCLSLLLSTLETTIVSTSLVSITNALGGFEQRDWVVTSYLITYTGKH